MVDINSKLGGILLIVAVCICAVSQTETTVAANNAFDYPLATRYINMIETMIIWTVVPIFKCIKRRQRSEQRKRNAVRERNARKRPNMRSSAHATASFTVETSPSLASEREDELSEDEKEISIDIIHSGPLRRKFYIIVFIGAIQITVSGMLNYYSLNGTSVPTNVSMGGLKPIFVLILSIFVLKEELNCWKALAIVSAVLGVFCYGLEANNNKSNSHSHSSSDEQSDTVWGCAVAVGAYFLYAIGDILAKLASEAYAYRVMGSIVYVATEGVIATVLFIWVLWVPQNVIGHVHTDGFSNVFTSSALFWVLFNGMVLLIYNTVVFAAVVFKSPLFVNIGVLMAIPVSFVVDIIIHGYEASVLAIVGAILLLLAFLMLEILQPPKHPKLEWLNTPFINAPKPETPLLGEIEPDIEQNNSATVNTSSYLQSSQSKMSPLVLPKDS